MHWNVVSAKHLDGYRLAVTFADGTSGVVDLARHVRAGGVFARLSDVNTFKQFTINPDFGTICWGDDLDIAPETLYYEVVGVPSSAMLHEAPSEYCRKAKQSRGQLMRMSIDQGVYHLLASRAEKAQQVC